MTEQGNRNESQVKFKVKKPDATDKVLANKIAGWTERAGNMIPKKPEEILTLFEKGHSIVGINTEDEEVVHGAITYTNSDGSIEIGALFTAEEHRGKGAGTFAIKEVVALAEEIFPGQLIYALANANSARLFKKLGASEMKHSELSSEVWEPCDTCPKNPVKFGTNTEFKCCDTPYNLTKIKK